MMLGLVPSVQGQVQKQIPLLSHSGGEGFVGDVGFGCVAFVG